MIHNNPTASSPSDSSYQSHTEFFLIAAAAALVGYIVIYLAFFDSTALL